MAPAKKKRKGSKTAKARSARPKAAKAKKGKASKAKAKAAFALPTFETTCEGCVRGAVDEWCGSHIISGETSLKQAHAPNGACNNGSLRRLAKILHDRCGVEVDPDNLDCSMTVADLNLVICGT